MIKEKELQKPPKWRSRQELPDILNELGLLDRGVLIRETGPESYLRVSVGTPEENAAFRAALEEVTA